MASKPTTADDVGQLLAPSPRVSGSILRGPIDTELPDNSYDDLDSKLKDCGFVDEDGIKQREDRSTTDQFVWGGDLVGTLQERYSRTVSFTLMQFMNENTLKTGYGKSNVSTSDASSDHGKEFSVKMNPRLLETNAWVFDGFYMDRLARIVLPIARVVTLGDVNMTHREYMTLEVSSLKCYPDEDGNHGYMYFNDGEKLDDDSDEDDS